MKTNNKYFFILAMFLSLSCGVYAAVLWVGPTDANAVNGDWFDGANWNSGACPTSLDDAEMKLTDPNAVPILIDNGGTVVAEAKYLTIAGNATPAGYGKLEIAAGSSLNLLGRLYVAKDGANAYGDITCAGNITVADQIWMPQKGTANVILTGDAVVRGTTQSSYFGAYGLGYLNLTADGNAHFLIRDAKFDGSAPDPNNYNNIVFAGNSVWTVDGSATATTSPMTPGNGRACYFNKTGVLTIKDNATWNFNARLNSNKAWQNTYNFQDNCTVNATGTHFNFANDIVNIEGGTIDFQSNYGLCLYDGSVLNQSGGVVQSSNGKSLEVNTPSIYNFSGGILKANLDDRTVGGFHMTGGTFASQIAYRAFTQVGGIVAPGVDAIGVVDFRNNYTIDPNSTSPSIAIQLAGTGAGQYDKVLVSGIASIDGTLDVSFLSGFESTIAIGDSFEIIKAGTVTGMFTNVVDDILVVSHGGTDYEFLVINTGTAVMLTRGTNFPPAAEAGATLMIFDPNTTGTLVGSYVDDGRPAGVTPTIQWSVVSQPAGSTVTFSAPTSLTTDITVDTLGAYTVQLLVNDSEFDGTDTVSVIYSDATPIVGPVIAHYTFDQADQFDDSSSNNLALVPGGDASITTDSAVGDGALRLAGTGFATRTLAQSLPYNDELTVSYWYKEDPAQPASPWSGIIGDGYDISASGPDYGFIVLRPDSGRFKWQVKGIDPGTLEYNTPADGPAFADNKWHQIVCTFSTIQNVTNVYVDGLLRDTNALVGGTLVKPENALILIGNAKGDSGLFKGWIDEVKILTYEVDAATVADDYTSVTGDYNFDGVVDLNDVAEIGSGWQSTYDMVDLQNIAANWLDGKL